MADATAAKPLSVLRRAAARPLLAAACRVPDLKPGYDRATHWLGVFWEHLNDFLFATLPRGDRRDYVQFMMTVGPVVQELHEITGEVLLPAIAGAEIMFTIDGDGLLPTLPGLRLDRGDPDPTNGRESGRSGLPHHHRYVGQGRET